MSNRRQIVIPSRESGEADATDKQLEFIRQLVKRNGISGFKVKSLGKWQASAVIEQLQSIDAERAQAIRVERIPARKSCGCGCLALLLLAPLAVAVWVVNCSGGGSGGSSATPPASQPDADRDATEPPAVDRPEPDPPAIEPDPVHPDPPRTYNAQAQRDQVRGLVEVVVMLGRGTREDYDDTIRSRSGGAMLGRLYELADTSNWPAGAADTIREVVAELRGLVSSWIDGTGDGAAIRDALDTLRDRLDNLDG